MRIIRCDRCGKDFPKGVSKVGFAEVKTIDAWTGEIKEEDQECKEWDLCPECTDKIRLFIKNADYFELIEAAAAEAEAETPERKTPAKEKRKEKPKTDRDKVWELWQEGWSYKAIAKELGYTEQEVKACI